mmetsp:Transcript_26122/g.66492  ORF Transcript_26122/g.66492 Transcript_26122/m.66492 type:complete len:203 (+) Transcript_26122:1871-2479(+)
MLPCRLGPAEPAASSALTLSDPLITRLSSLLIFLNSPFFFLLPPSEPSPGRPLPALPCSLPSPPTGSPASASDPPPKDGALNPPCCAASPPRRLLAAGALLEGVPRLGPAFMLAVKRLSRPPTTSPLLSCDATSMDLASLLGLPDAPPAEQDCVAREGDAPRSMDATPRRGLPSAAPPGMSGAEPSSLQELKLQLVPRAEAS